MHRFHRQRIRRERIKTVLVLLAVIGFAALAVYGAWLSFDQCLADGYSVTECRALMSGRNGIVVGGGAK